MYRVWVRYRDNSSISDEMDLASRDLAEWIICQEIAYGNAAGMVFHPELA